MANNCSNNTSNACRPCTGCKDVISSDCVSVQSSISCINVQTGDTLTDALNAIGSYMCGAISDGYLLTVEESDGSPSYDQISTLMFDQDSGFVVDQPSANHAEVKFTPVFLLQGANFVTVDMVTTGNITLSGVQNIDSQTGSVGSKVLVWKQTVQSQNGVYTQAVGAWTRSTDSDTTGELNNQVVFANYPIAGSTYGGQYFNQIIVSPTIGADIIVYEPWKFGGNQLSWVYNGNEVSEEKTIGTLDTFDLPFITDGTEQMRLKTTGELLLNFASSPLGTLHIKGNASQSPLYIINDAGTHSIEYRDSGKIYRNSNVFSIPYSSTNVSWGLDAGTANTGTGGTFIGANAGKANVSGLNSTFLGYNAGVVSNATAVTAIGANSLLANVSGINLVAVGTSAGVSNTAKHNTYIGYHAGSSQTSGENGIYIGAFAGRHYLSGFANQAWNGNIFIGDECADGFKLGDYNIFIGQAQGKGGDLGADRNILIGNSVLMTGFSYSDIVPAFNTTGLTDSLGIGNKVTIYASNQIVFGSETYPYTDMYIGEGVLSTTPQAISINGTGGSGTDIQGGNLILSGGKSTGAASPASILFKTSTIGNTGSTLQSLATKMTIDGVKTTFQARAELAKGTSTAAANDLTLPLDGNIFTITGNTTINAITTANWQAGSIIYLILTGTPIVKHNTAGGAGTATMKLASGVDFTISKNPTVLGLLYDGTNWLEISRSANAA